jgi:hypothetical protein
MAGSVGSAGITGTLDTSTPAPAFSGSGSVAVTGALAGTIPAPIFDALGAILTPVVGILDATMDAPTFTAQGSSGAQVAAGYPIPRHAAQPILPLITGTMAASLPAPTLEAFGETLQIESPQPSRIPLQLTAPIPYVPEPMRYAPEPIPYDETPNPVSIQIWASLPAPPLALDGSVIHEAALAATLDAPTFHALGEVGEAYDDSEDLIIALMMLEAA